MEKAIATVVVGPLARGRVRNLVLHAQLVGYDVTLTEGSGWLSRPMFISGDGMAVRWIYTELQALGMEED